MTTTPPTWPAPVPASERLPAPMPENPRYSVCVLAFDGNWFGPVQYDFQERAWGWAAEPTHWLPLPPDPSPAGGPGAEGEG